MNSIPSTRGHQLAFAGIAVFALFTLFTPLKAANTTWNNPPATGNFSTSGNWSQAPGFGASCVLHFAASVSNSIYMGTGQAVNQLNFDANASAYTIRLANTWAGTTVENLTFDGTTPQINITSGAAAEVIGVAGGSVVLNQGLTINNSGGNALTLSQGISNGSTTAISTLTNASTGSGNITISGIIADGASQKTALVQNSATSVMTINAANTFSGGVIVQQGGLTGITQNTCFGNPTVPITLGSSIGGSATLASGKMITNAINLGAGALGTLVISNNNAGSVPVFSGPISLNGDNLTLCAGGTGGNNFSGGITGVGNITLDNEPTTCNLQVSGNSIDNSGTITAQGGSTGATTISAPVGQNVTAITATSTTSALTISGMLTNNSGGTTLTHNGGKLFTVSGGTTGTGSLTVNDNSTANMSLTTAAINHTGAFINSGSGTGTVTVSAAIGSNVNGLTENSASAKLVLSGPNTYTGNTTLTAGTVELNYLETPGTSGPLGNQTGTIILNGGTLQYTANNTADYSSRFSTAPNQAYNIDVNGQVITYATALNSSGGTLNLASTVAGGSLILSAASSYSGDTTIGAGAKLVGVVGGSLANSAVTVNADTATNGVLISNNTLSWTESSLNVAASGDLDFNFGSIAPSTTVSPLVVTGSANFAAQPTVTIEGVNILPGTYPLMTWGSQSGTVPTTVVMPVGSAGSLTVAGNTLELVVTTGTVVFKDNNTTSLDIGSSWVGGVVPTGVAAWNNTVTSANNVTLGSDLSFAVLEISNPGGPVDILADGNTLTNLATIDLSAATQDLTLGCNLDLGGNNTWIVSSGRTLTINGVISDTNTVAKQGGGTLVYDNLNTYTNSTDVSAGVLTIGSAGAYTNFGTLTVADTASTAATLNINGGVLVTVGNSVGVGKANGANGVINMTSGNLMMTNQLFLGNAAPGVAGFGAMNISGGNAYVSGYVTAGRGASGTSQSRGEILVSGPGTLFENANNMQIGSDNTAITNTSVMLLSGASTTTLNSAAGSVIVGRVADGTLTVSNTAQLLIANNSTLQFGQASGVVGILNLNGGTINVPTVVQGAGSGYFDFNGGTLKAAKSSISFITNLTAVYVYPGGAIIDDGGFVITNSQGLLAPTSGSGKGVSLAGMTFGGSGFVAPPIVDVVAAPGDPGVGASALATIDGSGNLTGVSIVSPGVNYVAAPTLMFTGGGGTVTHTGNVSLTANSSSGGLTKNGVGSLILSGVSTYAGNTIINAGILGFSGSGSIASSPNVQINAGAELAGFTGSSAVSGAAVALASTTSTNSVSITANNLSWTCASLTCSAAGVLDFDFGSVAPGTTVAPFQVTGAAAFAATPTVTIEGNNITAGTYPLMTWGSTSGTAPTTAQLNLPAGVVGTLNISGKTLNLVVTTGNVLVKANNANNLNLTTSWVTGVVPTGAAIWDATVTSANTTVLGADLNWAGMQILNPGGPVIINADGNSLTNGASGIDMSAATVNLTLDCNLVLSNAQPWNVASGRTLTANGPIATLAGGSINKQGLGTLVINSSVNYSNTEDVLGGTLIYSGAAVTSTGRVIPDATTNTFARLVITNGASVISTSSNGNLRSGRAGAATGTNYVDLGGLYTLTGPDAADGFATLYGSCAYSEMTFLPGGDFTARGVTNYTGVGNTVFRFNGGILRALQNNTTFFQGISNTYVMSGGANIDDRGFAIIINQNLLNGGGGGGLNKIGTGTLTLNGINTYTGTTTVSNGTLVVSGQIAGPTSLVVNTNANLTFNSNITLGGNTLLYVTKTGGVATNGVIETLGSLTYGGQLQVVLTGSTPLAVNDTFQLFNFINPPLGAFSVTNLPAGYTWDASQLAVNGTIKVTGTGTRTHPKFTQLTISGGSLILNGTNATGSYVLYSTTNLTTPVANWVPVFTNTFSGNFSFTNTMSGPRQFYLLQ